MQRHRLLIALITMTLFSSSNAAIPWSQLWPSSSSTTAQDAEQAKIDRINGVLMIGNLDAIKTLLEVEERAFQENHALYLKTIIQCGHVEVLRYIVENQCVAFKFQNGKRIQPKGYNADDDHHDYYDICNGFLLAVQANKPEIIDYLLSINALDLTAQDGLLTSNKHINKALHTALTLGNADMLKRLFAWGVDSTVKVDGVFTALELAQLNQKNEHDTTMTQAALEAAQTQKPEQNYGSLCESHRTSALDYGSHFGIRANIAADRENTARSIVRKHFIDQCKRSGEKMAPQNAVESQKPAEPAQSTVQSDSLSNPSAAAAVEDTESNTQKTPPAPAPLLPMPASSASSSALEAAVIVAAPELPLQPATPKADSSE